MSFEHESSFYYVKKVPYYVHIQSFQKTASYFVIALAGLQIIIFQVSGSTVHSTLKNSNAEE